METEVDVAIPPLRHGDRLTRDEFERRYHAMPGVKKAELIDGVVHMPSPVHARQHSNPHGRLMAWLADFEERTPGIFLGDNGTVRLDAANEPQPDGLLLILPEYGGQARISDDDYIEFAPELVAEVSASTEATDLGRKFDIYATRGVREYVVWLVNRGEIVWSVRRDDQFVPLPPGPDGVFRSEVLPGLWLDPSSLIHRDRARRIAVADSGAASPEYLAFVAGLAARFAAHGQGG
jgi:Uma2 family endonuclease